MGYSYGSDESVGVNFRAGPILEPTLGLRIESKAHKSIEETPPEAAAHFRDITLKMAAHGAAFEFGSQWFREAQVRSGKSLDIRNPLPESAWGTLDDPGLHLSELKLTSQVLRYQAPTLVHAFRMENDDLEVLISTSGFQTSELAELLSHIGPINDRPDVWQRYERETAERLKELGHDPSVDP
jgi:hypothetical protein